MFVNKIPFLTTISTNIMSRTAYPLRDKYPDEYKAQLEMVLCVYNKAGFQVTRIKADQEFKPLKGNWEKEHKLTIILTPAHTKVPEAERNNQTIKERYRSAYQRLPYKNIPRIMVETLVMESAKKLNFFPPKGGVSQYYSPRMLLHQKKLDYFKHCNHEF